MTEHPVQIGLSKTGTVLVHTVEKSRGTLALGRAPAKAQTMALELGLSSPLALAFLFRLTFSGFFWVRHRHLINFIASCLNREDSVSSWDPWPQDASAGLLHTHPWANHCGQGGETLLIVWAGLMVEHEVRVVKPPMAYVASECKGFLKEIRPCSQMLWLGTWAHSACFLIYKIGTITLVSGTKQRINELTHCVLRALLDPWETLDKYLLV